MTFGEYLAGAVVFTLVWGSAAVAATLIVRARLAWVAPEARAVAWAVLGLGALVLAHLVPLALGVLSRGTVIAASLLVALGATRVRRVPAEDAEQARGEPSDRTEWALGLLCAGIAATYVVAFLGVNRYLPIHDIDSTGFHLPVVGRWIQTGSVWRTDDFSPLSAFGAYPQTGDLVQLALIQPWRNDFLLRALNPALLGFTVLGTYALATELRARRGPALAVASAIALSPALLIRGVASAMTDPFMVATFVAGALFLVRHARTRRTPDLLLAGVALGLAFGSKWYGPPEVAALLLVAVLARVVAGERWRRPLRDGAKVAVVVGAVGGFWLLRNLVVTGDPLFPATIALGGLTLFDGAHTPISDHDFSLLHYIGDPDVLRQWVAPQLDAAFALPAALVVAGVLVGAVAAWRARRGRVLAVAMAGLAVLLVYLATPNTGFGLPGEPTITVAARYAGPGLVLCAAVTAWLAGRARWAALLIPLLAAAAMLQATSTYDVAFPEFARVGAAWLAAAAAGLATLALAGIWLRRRRPSTRALAVAAVVAAALLVLGGREYEQRFNASRYRGLSAVSDFFARDADPGHRVALVGRIGNRPYSLHYLAFGPRLRNTVEYAGRRVDHLLTPYESGPAFAAHLRRGDYDLLVVGLRRGTGFRELEWARDAGWRPVAEDSLHTLLARPASP